MQDFIVIAIAVVVVICAWFLFGKDQCWFRKPSPRERASDIWDDWREELVDLGQTTKPVRVTSQDGITSLSFSPTLGGGELVISREGGKWEQAWAAPDEWMADAAPLYPALYAAVVDEVLASTKKRKADTSPALSAMNIADADIELAGLRIAAKRKR